MHYYVISQSGEQQFLLFLKCFLPLHSYTVKFKHIYFTLIEKQVLTPHTNLCQFCFLGTTPVLMPNMWANENTKVDKG